MNSEKFDCLKTKRKEKKSTNPKNDPKTRLRYPSKTPPRFRDRTKIFPDPRSLSYHSLACNVLSLKIINFLPHHPLKAMLSSLYLNSARKQEHYFTWKKITLFDNILDLKIIIRFFIYSLIV